MLQDRITYNSNTLFKRNVFLAWWHVIPYLSCITVLYAYMSFTSMHVFKCKCIYFVKKLYGIICIDDCVWFWFMKCELGSHKTSAFCFTGVFVCVKFLGPWCHTKDNFMARRCLLFRIYVYLFGINIMFYCLEILPLPSWVVDICLSSRHESFPFVPSSNRCLFWGLKGKLKQMRLLALSCF